VPCCKLSCCGEARLGDDRGLLAARVLLDVSGFEGDRDEVGQRVCCLHVQLGGVGLVLLNVNADGGAHGALQAEKSGG